MARRPDVSIIIPTLDEEKYIEDALNALTSQKTSLSYEIILGDGRSKDRTVKIGERYGARAVYEPKRTISAGRQKGAEAALGGIIVNSGADVHMEPHWLDRLVEPILGGTHVASMGPVLPRDGNWAERLFSAGVLKPLGHGLSRLGFHFVVADNMAVRSDIFRKAGGVQHGPRHRGRHGLDKEGSAARQGRLRAGCAHLRFHEEGARLGVCEIPAFPHIELPQVPFQRGRARGIRAGAVASLAAGTRNRRFFRQFPEFSAHRFISLLGEFSASVRRWNLHGR